MGKPTQPTVAQLLTRNQWRGMMNPIQNGLTSDERAQIVELDSASAERKRADALSEHLDLMIDEFKRIKSLCSAHDMPRSLAGEISGICDRAVTNTRQKVPLIVQRDDWERKSWELDHQWSIRFRDEKALATNLKNENEALRDVIEALHDSVEGKRFDDASVAELLNGAMKIPRATILPTSGASRENEKGQRPGDKNAMKNTETQSPGSLHRMVRRLFDARQAAAAAKKARAEKAAEVGDCEYFDADARGEEMGVKCYNTKRKEWCAVCLAKQPFYDDYQRKAALAGAALQAVLRAGKRMTPNSRIEQTFCPSMHGANCAYHW